MEHVEFVRDCEVTAIPAGNTVTLEKGTAAIVTQSLGGSFTLQVPAYGGLFRLGGADADAIGKDAVKGPELAEGESATLENQAWALLKTCYDPEIPVNIVDLGLVYDMRVTPTDGGCSRIDVKMTLTAPGCGMGPVIAAEAQQKLNDLEGVSEALVDIVWDPPWSPQMISEEGKERLGMV